MPQGTVKSFDHRTHESVLLTDDLVEHVVPAATFEAAPLLELRVGQRVRFEFVDDGEGGETVGHLGIVSL
ncbi:copper-binding protein [Salsipaludibacter albus]|uniref:copper-binding protein n=1 Tax=Salsipaludibacter albus TaxID=2849650 RepID=UPI001EE4ACD9|nr:copper-binding protein [Salsipaludibacter albus]MBY5162360.1 copper-binding protein [Salsipaludibacter albus]